ncbi:MAG: hypothetical protein GY754_31250 [bacterium]|nr:hypothetical protein [bacterium]
MDIKCDNCGQKYYVPDDRIDDKRAYFNCERCDHKIIINHKKESHAGTQRGKESWYSYKGLQSSVLTAKDILDGVFYSFNMKNVLISFLTLFSISLLLFIIMLISTGSNEFFAQNSFLLGIMSYLLFIILVFAYDIHLYLLSRNVFHRLRQDRNIRFSSVKEEISHDFKPISVFSIMTFLLFGILIIPVYPLRDIHELIYTGIFQSVFAFLAFVIVVVFYMKNILYSFIALKHRRVGETFRSMFKFIAVENINIPIYLFLSNFISTVIYLLFTAFFISGLGFIAYFLSGALDNYSSSALNLLPFLSGASMGTMDKALTPVVPALSGGVILILIFTYIVFLFIIAFFTNLAQTLSTVAVYIMESNPGRSVSRSGRFLALGVLFVIFLSPFIYYSLEGSARFFTLAALFVLFVAPFIYSLFGGERS